MIGKLTTILLLFLALAPPAAARDASSSEVARLAHDATFDQRALEELNEIDSIDGRPVDLDRMLAGAEGEEIEQRVTTLLQSGAESPAPDDPAAAREQAREILGQDRYRADEIPRPFRGPLEWIAERLEPVGDALDSIFGWIADVFDSLARGTPGGAATLWLLIGLIVVTLVTIQTRSVIARRTHAESGDGKVTELTRSDDPRELERRAAAARESGDHELAVRLLFRAGLLRLARARAIPPRSSLTTGEIRRLLRSPDFDRLGRSFDEIAYGRRPATASDTETAWTGWSRVLQELAG